MARKNPTKKRVEPRMGSAGDAGIRPMLDGRICNIRHPEIPDTCQAMKP